MKKFLKVLLTIVSIITIIFSLNFITFNDKVYADVGNFKSYSSSGSRSSSSSSSGSRSSSSSSSSSRRSSSNSESSSSSSTLGEIGLIMFAIRHPWAFLLFIVLVAIWRTIKKKLGNNPIINKYNETLDNVFNTDKENNFNNRSAQSEESVLSSVKAIDPNFNPEEFKAFARDVYIRLQAAWSKGDWEDIRTFESNELFEQHRNQLQEYLDKGQLNKMDRVGVLNEKYAGFKQEAGKDVLEIDLDVKQIDYIINSKTKEIVIGDPNLEDYGTYRLTFSRTTGNTTNVATGETKITNCPNCGAPTTITSSGKCPYCGSVITTTDYGWVLSNLSKIS